MTISGCTILLLEDEPDTAFLNERPELQNHVPAAPSNAQPQNRVFS
jgi:hypothetical protein